MFVFSTERLPSQYEIRLSAAVRAFLPILPGKEEWSVVLLEMEWRSPEMLIMIIQISYVAWHLRIHGYLFAELT